jgi:hypothetical protein
VNINIVPELDDRVVRTDEAWVLEERGRYRVIAPDADSATFGGAELERDRVGFILVLSFWTGRAFFEVRRGDVVESVSLLVQAPTHKIEASEWETLLDEIDRRWPGCTLGVEGGLHGQAGARGLDRMLALLAFEPLLDDVLKDLATLLDALRTKENFPAQMVPLRSLRRLDVSSTRWIATHPQLAYALRSNTEFTGNRGDALVPHRRRVVSLDHPANRAIRWLFDRLANRLKVVALMLRARSEALAFSLTDAKSWCDQRALKLGCAAERIDRLVRCSPLSLVEPTPPDTSALSTLASDPLYARVFRRCRRWLAPRFEHDGKESEGDVPIRASFDLYERWCLLAIRRALAEAFPDARWRDSSTSATDIFDPPSGGVASIGISASGTVTLYDNLSFEPWSGGSDRFSITTRRRPDFVITWHSREGLRSWVVLDAKYRASYDSIALALSELHVYRDSLRWPDYLGPCQAAVALVPAAETRALEWGTAPYLERFHFGIVLTRPSIAITFLARLLQRWLTMASPMRTELASH